MDFHVISVVINPSPDITREAKGLECDIRSRVDYKDIT